MPTTQNMEGERSEVQDHRWLLSKFEANLGKVRSSKKQTIKSKNPKEQ